jgi:hypothetical protein
MFYAAEADIVTNGGPSAPAWAFFTALTVGVLALITQQLNARSELRRIRTQTERTTSEASKAAKSAVQAEKNTQELSGLSNGFAGRVDNKLDEILRVQQATEDALRDHLQWHLHRESK